MNVMIPDSAAVYLPAMKVCERYGVTDMTLWRWLRDDRLNFPRPVYIGRNRYFAIAELDAFDAAQRAKSPDPRAKTQRAEETAAA